MAIEPQYLAELERQHQLPAGLLNAVMMKESAGDPNAVSPKGAQGLFQFMPDTAQAYGIDPLDPQQAAQGAARMYSDLSKQYNGDLSSMLAAYNWGSGNLAKHGMQNAPAETRDYIDTIAGQLQNQALSQQYAQADNVATDAQVSDVFEVEMPDGTIIENIPVGTPPDEIEAAWKAMTQKPDTKEDDGWISDVADFVVDEASAVPRQIGLTGRHAAEGLASIADLPNMAINAVSGAIGGGQLAYPSDMVSRGLDRLGVPKPENALERVVGDASRALAGTGGTIGGASALARYAPSLAPLAENAAIQAKAATGSSVASGATREAGGGPLAQLAAGLAGGIGSTAISIPKKELYTAADVKKFAQDAYNKAESLGGAIKPDSASKLLDSIEESLPQDRASILMEGNSPARQALTQIRQLTNKPINLKEAESIDRILGNMASKYVNPNGTMQNEGREVLTIQSAFRDMIEKAADDALIGGKEGFSAWRDATKLWSKAMKLQDIERIIERADVSDNPATSIRSGFRQLMNSKRYNKFTPEEQAAIKRTAKSGIIDEALRAVSSRLPAIIGLGSGNPIIGALGIPAGAAAREGGALLQLNRVAKTAEKIAGSKPRDAIGAWRSGGIGTSGGLRETNYNR